MKLTYRYCTTRLFCALPPPPKHTGLLGGNMIHLADIKWYDACMEECPEGNPENKTEAECCVAGSSTCCVLMEGVPSLVSTPLATKFGGWSIEGASANYQTNMAVPNDMHELTSSYARCTTRDLS